MKVVVKVGTQAILNADGIINETVLLALVQQIAHLQQLGHQVALVSSGSVGTGQAIARSVNYRAIKDPTAQRQLLSSLGQHELIAYYAKLFKPYGLQVAQLLLTKQDFHSRHHYLNISRLIDEILRHKTIIPIINENDTVAIDESMFTDNDELAGLIAAQMGVDKLIILTSVAGVYDRPPNSTGAKLISVIDPDENQWPQPSTIKSCQGRGGMMTKLHICRKMSALGTTVHIAKMSEPNIIGRIFDGESVGTTVLPKRRKSTIKKWIAFSADQHRGAIYVNRCLADILTTDARAVSILPVGIEKLYGSFDKGDLVEILNSDGERIGVGMARYDSQQLQPYLGQQHKPVFIHYNHLYLVVDGVKRSGE